MSSRPHMVSPSLPLLNSAEQHKNSVCLNPKSSASPIPRQHSNHENDSCCICPHHSCSSEYTNFRYSGHTCTSANKLFVKIMLTPFLQKTRRCRTFSLCVKLCCIQFQQRASPLPYTFHFISFHFSLV